MWKFARYSLFGALGFGIGALLYSRAKSLALATEFEPYWALGVIHLTVFLLGFVARGALGGLALGIALRRKKRALALWGGGGFLAGSLLASLVAEGISPLYLILEGAIGGASLGLALKYRRKIVGLAIAGALGQVTGTMIMYLLIFRIFRNLVVSNFFIGSAVSSLPGIITGVLLGMTLAYLDKK